MSRDDGFPIADVDPALLDDPKIRALVRATKDEAAIARAVVAYIATVLRSWAHGDRQTLTDAAPLWLSGIDDLAERLAAVGLVDAEGRIPERGWENWFRPAWERREKKRAGGRIGGIRSWEARSKHSVGTPSAKPNPSDPSHPSDPSDPTSRPRGKRSAARAVDPSGNTNGAATEPCGICHEPPDGTGKLVDVGGAWVFAHARCLPPIGGPGQ
jgi:hypothetical protein